MVVSLDKEEHHPKHSPHAAHPKGHAAETHPKGHAPKEPPAKEAKSEEPELRHVEKSLFADVQDDDKIGLLDTKRRPETQPSGGEKQIVLRFNPQSIKAKAKKGLFWLALVILVVSFFYNPFYCRFPWNHYYCTGWGPTDEEGGVAEEEAVAEETPTEEPAAPEEPEAEPEETPLPPPEEEPEEELEAPAVNETSNVTASGAAEGEFILTITDVELIKTTYGWKVGKISFSVDNNKETFVGKVRARGFNSPNRMDMRSDKDKILGTLQKGDKLDDSIQLDAQFDKAGDKLVLLELFDEGGEPGSAKDRRMASAEQKVTAK